MRSLQTHLLPTLELRLPRLGEEFVAVYAEKAAGHTWEYGGGTGWSWVARHIAEHERDGVVEQLTRAIQQFKRCGHSDATLLDVVFESDGPIEDDNKSDAYEAEYRLGKCLRAVTDLEETVAALTKEQGRG